MQSSHSAPILALHCVWSRMLGLQIILIFATPVKLLFARFASIYGHLLHLFLLQPRELPKTSNPHYLGISTNPAIFHGPAAVHAGFPEGPLDFSPATLLHVFLLRPRELPKTSNPHYRDQATRPSESAPTWPKMKTETA